MDYGANIRAARKAAGLTQKQLAERLGISFVNISQLENNQRTPNLGTLERIANALDIHVFDLTGVGKELDKYRVEVTNLNRNGTPIEPAEQTEINKMLARGPRDLYDELSDENKAEFWSILMKPLHLQLSEAFVKLNEDGQEIAVQRVRELSHIPEYRRKQQADTSEASSEDKE